MRKKLEIPTPEHSLPGRAIKMPVPAAHFVNGNPLGGAVPGGAGDGGVRARLLLGRRAQVLGGAGRLDDRGRLCRRLDAQPDLRGGVQRAAPATPRSCSSSSTRSRSSYEALLKIFWESHDPTQGMRQGNDVGTQYRSAIYTYSPEQRRAAEASRERLPGRSSTDAGYGAHHHRDPRRAAILLRRGLPPAISGEEPVRLLRPRRHRRHLPDRDLPSRRSEDRGRPARML